MVIGTVVSGELDLVHVELASLVHLYLQIDGVVVDNLLVGHNLVAEVSVVDIKTAHIGLSLLGLSVGTEPGAGGLAVVCVSLLDVEDVVQLK